MALGFSNPIGQSAQAAITVSQRNLTRSGEAIATGRKSPISDIVGYILGSSLSNKAAVLGSLTKGVNYGINMLNVAMSSLRAIEKNQLKQLQLIAEAGTPGATQLAQLQDTFDDLSVENNRIARFSQFDGRNLLDGALTVTPLNIRLGINFADAVQVAIADTRIAAIYFDTVNNGFVGAPDIQTDNASRLIADTVINYALNDVRTKIAAVGSQISNLEGSLDTMAQSRIAQQNGADANLNTDYEQEVDNFTENLNMSQASVFTIIKSAVLPQVVLQLIQNA